MMVIISSKHLFLCVHFKTSSFAREEVKRGKLYKDERPASIFSTPTPVIQLTWLSRVRKKDGKNFCIPSTIVG